MMMTRGSRRGVHRFGNYHFKEPLILCHISDVPLPQDANFTTAVELAVRFGKTLIIQEMDGVEPVLYPLLRGDLVAQGMSSMPYMYSLAHVVVRTWGQLCHWLKSALVSKTTLHVHSLWTASSVQVPGLWFRLGRRP